MKQPHSLRSVLVMPVLAAILSVLMPACSGIECPVQNTVSTIYTVEKDGQTQTLEDTLWVFTRRSDDSLVLLLNGGVNLQTFQLPISLNNPCDTLFFLIADTLHVQTLDTVWVAKEDLPQFESVDCDAAFFHRLLSAVSTHNGIDTLVVNKDMVDYDAGTEHFHISFKKRYP